MVAKTRVAFAVPWRSFWYAGFQHEGLAHPGHGFSDLCYICCAFLGLTHSKQAVGLPLPQPLGTPSLGKGSSLRLTGVKLMATQ